MSDQHQPDGGPAEEATLFPKTAGERLREARQSKGMSLAEVAERTRVPIRHLEGIENSDFSSLPSPTYAVGFAKAYARAVGVDEALIGREVRGHGAVSAAPVAQYQPYQAADPKRLPPRGLAIGMAVAALLLVVALGVIYGTGLFQGGETAPTTDVTDARPAPAAPAAPVPTAAPSPASGQVVLTANDIVWLRVYTPDKTLYQAEMKPGDRYEVPIDAVKPMINVGRPDKLTVTVNGSAVAPLGSGERAIKDVELTAAALLARAAPEAKPTPIPTAASGSTTAARRDTERRKLASPPPDSSADETSRANAAAASTLPGPTPTPTP